MNPYLEPTAEYCDRNAVPSVPDPPTAAAPIIPDRKSEAQRAYREARVAIALLQHRWPAAFPQVPQQIRPLITGLTSLIATTLDWSHPYARTVLRVWKLRPAYCHAVLAHPVRFDLEGNPTDQPIDEDTRAQAQARLAAWASKRWPAPRAVAPAVDHDPQQQGRTRSVGQQAAATAAAGSGAYTQAATPATDNPGLAPRRQGTLAGLQRHVSARDDRRSGRGADRHAYPPPAQNRAAVCRAAVSGDAVTLGDVVRRITMLEIACRPLDVATGQLGEVLSQVRALTDQRPARRRWWPWRRKL